MDPEEREALGAAARRAVVERHCWSHNVAHALSDPPSPADNRPERSLVNTL
jgi:hypothetical protein